MIDSFFLIQSLFFLLVIANTTTPLVSYPFIRHELLTCYPFQNVFISLWFCAVRACVLLLLLIRIVFMYCGFVTTTLLFSFPQGTVFPQLCLVTTSRPLNLTKQHYWKTVPEGEDNTMVSTLHLILDIMEEKQILCTFVGVYIVKPRLVARRR